MRSMVPKHILKISPYVPGKPIKEVERELGIKVKAKLASNENPIGPSPLAIKAIDEILSTSNRYPDSGGYYLRKKLAQRLGVNINEIILGNGTTELIELIARTFLAPEDNALIAERTFIMYPLALKAVNANYTAIPLKNYKYDLRAMAKAVNGKTKLVYIANPNNPTGTMLHTEEVEEFLESIPPQVIVVMDEAYYDYIDNPDYPDSFKYLREGRNIIILRTFSKAYGLAGLRVGYGIANQELLNYINRIRSPFNVNSLSQRAALAALDDNEHIEISRKHNKESMKFFTAELRKMGVKYVESTANFLLIITEADSEEIHKKLLLQGVIVRPMKNWGLPTALRVTVGIKKEIEEFLQAFARVLSD